MQNMALLKLDNRGPLPQELTDIVIDYLHDHPRTLKACSIVCQAWLPSSHWHLFYKIKVRHEHLSDERFIDALRSSETMPRSIHMLYILPSPPSADGMSGGTIPHALAQSVLDCLPVLHSITLRVSLANPEGSEVPQLRWTHPRLHRLHLDFEVHKSRVWQAVQTCNFFNAIPVNRLVVSGKIIQNRADIFRPISRVALDESTCLTGWAVKTLRMTNRSHSPAYIYLQILKHSLDSRVLTAVTTSDAPCMQPVRKAFREHLPVFLQSCTAIENLYLHLHRVRIPTRIRRRWDLSSVFAVETHPMRVIVSSFPISMFGDQPMPALRKLVVSFSGEGADNVQTGDPFEFWKDCTNWAALERVLLEMPMLAKAVFGLRNSAGVDIPLLLEQMRIVEGRLSKLHAAGKLSFK